MLIMGIDPGIAISGYGIISNENGKPYIVDYGTIRTSPKVSIPERLRILHNSYLELIDNYKPDAIAVEELFFNKNAKTIISVGQARGVALLSAALSNIDVYEYTPLQVKQAIVGYGHADKIQVQQMIKIYFDMNELPKPDDAADALAVALCHMHSYKLQNIIDSRGF